MTPKKGKIAIPTDEEVVQYAPTGEPETGGEIGPGSTSAEASGSGDTVQSLRAEIETWKDKLLRAQAECANIAKRLTQDHAESLRYAGMDLARSLLPVVDNLERTINGLSEVQAEEGAIQGVKLVAEQLSKALRDYGVMPVEVVGKPFDPSCHEAIIQDRESDAPAGTVTQELQRGYLMRDRLLRPAKVAVAVSDEVDQESALDGPTRADSSSSGGGRAGEDG